MMALGATIVGHLSAAALPLLALGAAGGWMYSLPPLALAWRGRGALTNAFLGGMLLPVFRFSVHAAGIEWRIFLPALPYVRFWS